MTTEPSQGLTPDERTEQDYWFQRLPSGGPEEALWNLMRLQIRHDTAGIRNAVSGSFELLDAADARAADLLDAARALTMTAETMTARMTAATEEIAGIRADLTTERQASEHDRLDLRQRSRLHRRWLWGLTLAVAALAIEALWRWWPVFSVLMLSFVALLWRW